MLGLIKDSHQTWISPDGRRLNRETAGPADETAPPGSPVSRCSTIGDKAGRGSCGGGGGGRAEAPRGEAGGDSGRTRTGLQGAPGRRSDREERASSPTFRKIAWRSARDRDSGAPGAHGGARPPRDEGLRSPPPGRGQRRHPTPRGLGQAQAPPPRRSRPLGVVVKMQPAEAQTARCKSEALRRRGRRAGGRGTGALIGTIFLGVVQTYFSPSPYRGRPSEIQLPATHMSLQQSFPATSVAGGRALRSSI